MQVSGIAYDHGDRVAKLFCNEIAWGLEDVQAAKAVRGHSTTDAPNAAPQPTDGLAIIQMSQITNYVDKSVSVQYMSSES